MTNTAVDEKLCKSDVYLLTTEIILKIQNRYKALALCFQLLFKLWKFVLARPNFKKFFFVDVFKGNSEKTSDLTLLYLCPGPAYDLFHFRSRSPFSQTARAAANIPQPPPFARKKSIKYGSNLAKLTHQRRVAATGNYV